MCGDLTGDLICYWIGRAGGAHLGSLGRRLGMRTVVTSDVQRGLFHSATKMLVIGKWTHSIGWLVLIGSGMLHVPLPRFILVNLIATVPKSTVLFGLGYFAGAHYPLFEQHVLLGTVALCASGGAAILLVLRKTDGIWAGGAGR